MKLIYPAIFHKDADGIWVEFPDLKGCHSCGENIEEVIEGAKEALEGYCMTLLEEKQKIPVASDIKNIVAGKNNFVTLVEADLTPYFGKRKSIGKPGLFPHV